MAMQLADLVPLALALLFGLGVPKAFSLLYVVLVCAAWFAARRPGARPSWWILWSFVLLLLFGVSYAAFQVGWQVWSPPQRFLPEILAVVLLPAAGLLVGWLLHRYGRRFGSRLMLAYALGALIYTLLALAMSRSPWWAITQQFDHVVRVPWGEDWMSTRSVEQRAFLALSLLPMGIPLLLSKEVSRRRLGLISVAIGALAVHVAWALDGRIGWAALALACLPWLCFLPSVRQRCLVVLCGSSLMGLAIGLGRLCDERWWLVNGFLSHLAEAPWGGRLMTFDYRECRPGIVMHFGSAAHSNAFAHNVILDIYNDTGIIPALCILMAVVPLVFNLLRGFWLKFFLSGWDWQLATRWGFMSVFVVQWLAQPFLYSDQLMFSIGFIFAGLVLADMSSHSPEDWPAARPSHHGISP
jgi:hypothetical protein